MGLLRRLFGAKKAPNDKKKASKSSSNNALPNSSGLSFPYDCNNLDANKHAIAVAAATAAVAEAALAAAQAAAEVVRLTNVGGGTVGGGRSAAPATQLSLSHRRWVEDVSSIKIQSAFRGYLARRALRALKALVKLQALVRGHLVRKQTTDMLRRMQTLVRLQARACASRTQMSEAWHSTSKSFRSRVPTNHHKDQPLHACSSKLDGPSILKGCGSNANFRDIIDQEKAKLDSNCLDRWMEESLWNNSGNTPLRNRHAYDERGDKILEVDTWKPHLKSQQSNRTFQQHVLAADHNNQNLVTFDSPSKLSTKAHSQMLSVSSGEALPLNSLKVPQGKDGAVFRAVEDSPRMFSATSRPGSSGRRGSFSPTMSECSWGYFNGYSGYPNYMANTESSRAKVRSQSAPRQRLEFERYGPSKRSVQGYYDTDSLSERCFVQHIDFRNKAHQAPGSLNRLGRTNLR